MQYAQTVSSVTPRARTRPALASSTAAFITNPAGSRRGDQIARITRPVVRDYATFLTDGPATCLVWF